MRRSGTGSPRAAAPPPCCAAPLAAAQELTGEQGSDVSKWNETVERGAFSAQGAGSAADLAPLPNRGSYGQVAEPQVAAAAVHGAVQPAAAGGTSPTTIGTPNTAAPSPSPLAALAAALLTAGSALAGRRRRRPGR